MKKRIVGLALVGVAVMASGITEREIQSRSELLCSNADVTIGINAAKGWLFHKDVNKEEGWEASVEKFEKLAGCPTCYKIQGNLPVPHPEVPFPHRLTVWAETRLGMTGKSLVMNYSFGLGRPLVKIDGLACRRGGW